MRKKINYQTTDYAENGELMCFGLSEHVMEERHYKLSEKAEAHIKKLHQWFDESMFDEHVTRPAFRSDNAIELKHVFRSQLRIILGVLFIRELPIKSFYSRAFITYFYFQWFLYRSLMKGVVSGQKHLLYNHPIYFKHLLNYPDLLYWSICRVCPSLPSRPDAHINWAAR